MLGFRRFSFTIFVALLCATLSSCERDIRYRGNLLDNDDIAILQKSHLSKNEIVEKFGFPTICLSDTEWIYISQKVEYKAFLKPIILETNATKLIFNGNGNCFPQKLTLKPILLTPLSTVTNIKEENLSFLEQLQKNIQNMEKH